MANTQDVRKKVFYLIENREKKRAELTVWGLFFEGSKIGEGQVKQINELREEIIKEWAKALNEITDIYYTFNIRKDTITVIIYYPTEKPENIHYDYLVINNQYYQAIVIDILRIEEGGTVRVYYPPVYNN